MLERESFSTPWREETFARLLDGGSGAEVWVAEEQSEDVTPDQRLESGISRGSGVLGYAVLWIVGDQAELANLAVRPDARGQGVGGSLLDQVLQRCRQASVTALYLEVRHSNEVARRLYEGRGFRTIGLRKSYYTRPREDARVMMLSLSPEVVAAP